MTMSLSTGLISGMDTGSLIAQLVQAEAAPQLALKARLTAAKDSASAYRTVNTTFLAVSAAAEAVLKPEAWTPSKATSSAAGVAVTATAGAASGSLTFTVTQLAASHAVMNQHPTPGTWTSSASLYGASEITVTDENNNLLSPPITVGGTGTLADAAAAINASDHGLTASVVQVSATEAALRISSKETGLRSKFTLTGAGGFTVNTAAADATISMGTTNPVAVSSPTNTFDSVMAGATFTVSKKDETATLTIASDPDAVAAKVQTLVDAINAAAQVTRDKTSNAPGSNATLKGDFNVSSLGGRLLDAVAFPIPRAGEDDAAPVDFGFQLTKDGKSIVFDKAKFLEALKADPALAQAMVGGTATGAGTDKKLGTVDDVKATGITGRLLAVATAASDETTGSLVKLAESQDARLDDIQDRIDAWDLRLEKRREMLTRQFTAMETALSSLRNQSTWLAGQINSLPSYS